MGKRKKANLITMGCSKNLVDSEKLAWQLNQHNYTVEHEAEKLNHDIVLINTCGFIKDAKEESVDIILQIAEQKKQGNIGEIVVFGCLVQRYFDELKEEIPEVDFWMGNYNTKQIMSLLKLDKTESDKRIINGFGHYAYLKISEGCDRNCSFCAIPIIKGKHKSRQIENIFTEAATLADAGVKEIILIAQDLSYYGKDISGKSLLPELINKLSSIDKIKWIRLHYLYPNTFPMEILDIMRDNDKVCSYLDIPLQHASDKVLKKMRRGSSKREIEDILDTARKKVPDIALRTTMMTGHPGESEEDFNELMEFVKKWRFERLGVFTYSEEEGTFGAKNFKDNIPDDVKQSRANNIMEEQQNISEELNSQKIGETLKVIVDGREGKSLICRSEFDSVEVDNEILVSTDEDIEPGTFIEVKILSATEFELEGRLVSVIND